MFTSTPQLFGSLYESQIFKFEGSFVEDQTFEVKEVISNEIIGVKKFYQTASSELNISPIVRSYAVPSPHCQAMGFIEDAKVGALSLCVTKTGSVESDEVVSNSTCLVLSHSQESDIALLSTLPLARTISDGEYDTIAVRCSHDGYVNIVVKQYLYDEATSEISTTPEVVDEYEVPGNGRGIALFNFQAEPAESIIDSGDDVACYEVIVTHKACVQSGGSSFYIPSVVGTISYLVIDPPVKPMRVAWISSRGSIEQYTMPYVVSETMQRNGERIYTLQSALETYSIREALAEIVSSEKVWVYNAEEEVYKPINVIDDEIELSPEDDLAVIKIKISYCD